MIKKDEYNFTPFLPSFIFKARLYDTCISVSYNIFQIKLARYKGILNNQNYRFSIQGKQCI